MLFETGDLSERGISLGSKDSFERESLRIYAAGYAIFCGKRHDYCVYANRHLPAVWGCGWVQQSVWKLRIKNCKVHSEQEMEDDMIRKQ